MTKHALLVGLVAGAAVGALAGPAMSDPPGRVGRVAALDGAVSFQPPGADEWSWASRNYPVTDGESFWTGDGGRVELQVGAVDVRADSETEVDVPTLRYGEMRLALPQGSLDIRVWRAPQGGVTVSTPAGDVHFDQAGLYRVDVGAPTDDGSYPVVEVTTLEGEAGAPSPEGLVTVAAGQGAVIYAGYDPELQDAQYTAIDDWGRELEAREHARPYDEDADTALTGYDDLAAAGEFTQDAQYGQVWFPRNVPPDWAPYRYGHWSYVEPWGYTWIDDQSWGFAPFHYGRWAQIDNRWAWIPGRATSRPVYAPALVAFIGGENWDFGGAGGAVGWVPLAPEEVYRPSYRVSDTYLRQVNVTNIRNTTVVNTLTVNNTLVSKVAVNSYRNVASATVVKAATFSGAGPVQRAVLSATPAVLARAPALAAASRPAPSAQARSGAPVAVAGRRATTVAAARPPERIAAVRAAVVAPPTAPNKPPVIVGARIAPPAPRSAGPARPVLVAPAQVRNPAAQRAAAAAAPRPAATTVARPPVSGTRPSPAPYAAPVAREAGPPVVSAGPAQAASRAKAAQELRQAQGKTAQEKAAQVQAIQAREAERRSAQTAQEARQAQERAATAQAARAQESRALAQAQTARAREVEARQAAQAREAQASAARNAAEAQARVAQQAQAADERARAAQRANAARQAQAQAETQARAAQAREVQAAEARNAAQAQARARAAQEAADKARKKPEPSVTPQP
ncbi:MAG: DUF6600 domain-containing protein [Caulobacteraceae bacterium]